jgi:SARP family transcriptional regulator, regulator of embCAB operon
MALLALNANQIVTADECVRELWGADPPRSAMSTLRTYILQIRRMLREVPSSHSSKQAGEILLARNQCIQLLLDAESLDCYAFERLIRQGRDAARRGDDHEAASRYEDALAVWRGPALIDVQHGPLISSHVAELTEQRLGTLEQRIEADLRLGRHHELLGELEILISRYPTNENIHAQLLLALYRSGRPQRAIDVFRRLRGVLDDGFGIEPSPRMQRLYQAILSGDPALENCLPGGTGRLQTSSGSPAR